MAQESYAEADGSVLLDGLTTLVEAKDARDLDLVLEADDLDVETLGGYVFGKVGRPAAVGDEVTASSGRLLRIEEFDGLRVARVRLLPPSLGRGDDAPPPGSEPTLSKGATANFRTPK